MTEAAPHARVLIAEDEAIIRLDLKEILLEEGYDVVAETNNGKDAIELAKELVPDLCILDIKMPGLDGLSVAREVLGSRLCAVLILTAFSQRDLVQTAREAGVYAYIVKPFQKTDLIPAIELALGRFAEMKMLEEEVSDLNARLEARKLIDRAKGMLMDVQRMGENEAFRFIQQSAMRDRLTMKVVAERLLSGEIDPTDSGL